MNSDMVLAASLTVAHDTRCGTSVRGPFRTVSELCLPSTQSDDSHATLVVPPGASKAASVAGAPATVSCPAGHDCAAFGARSGSAAWI